MPFGSSVWVANFSQVSHLISGSTPLLDTLSHVTSFSIQILHKPLGGTSKWEGKGRWRWSHFISFFPSRAEKKEHDTRMQIKVFWFPLSRSYTGCEEWILQGTLKLTWSWLPLLHHGSSICSQGEHSIRKKGKKKGIRKDGEATWARIIQRDHILSSPKTAISSETQFHLK